MKELGGLLLVGLLLAGSVEGQVRRGQAGAGTLSDEEAAYWGQVAAYSEETARWVNQDPLALDDPEGVFHEAVAVSPNGMNVVGTALVPGVGTVASVWLSREGGRLRYLEDEGGKPLIGAGVGVTDDGLVLVASSDGDSRLWHPSFGGAATRRLADVLAAYGQTLPADVTAPHSLIAFGRTYHIAVRSKTLGALHITLPNPLPGPGAQGLGIGSGAGTPGSVTPFGPISPFPTINGGRDNYVFPHVNNGETGMFTGGRSLDGLSKILYREWTGNSHKIYVYNNGVLATNNALGLGAVQLHPQISNLGSFAAFTAGSSGDSVFFTKDSGVTWSSFEPPSVQPVLGGPTYSGLEISMADHEAQPIVFDDASNLHLVWIAGRSAGTGPNYAAFYLKLAPDFNPASLPDPVVLGQFDILGSVPTDPGEATDWYVKTAITDTHLLILLGAGPLSLWNQTQPNYFIVNLAEQRVSQANMINSVGIDGLEPEDVNGDRFLITGLGGGDFVVMARYGMTPASNDNYASTVLEVIDEGGSNMHFSFNHPGLRPPWEPEVFRYTDLGKPGVVEGIGDLILPAPGLRTDYNAVIDAVWPAGGSSTPDAAVYMLAAAINANRLTVATFGVGGARDTFAVVDHTPGASVSSSDIRELSDYTAAIAANNNRELEIMSDTQSIPIFRGQLTSLYGKVGAAFCREERPLGSPGAPPIVSKCMEEVH